MKRKSGQFWLSNCPLELALQNQLQLIAITDDLLRLSRRKVAVDLDTWDAIPPERHEFINREVSPFVVCQTGDIAECDSAVLIVFGYVPSATSANIEELGHKVWVNNVFLRTEWKAVGKLSELYEKLCLFHIRKG